MNVLFVTRPLGSPWNEGGKNLAYGIAKNIKNHKIHLLVRENFNEKIGTNIVLHRIYPSKHKYNISYLEKLKLFYFLLKIKNIDIYHFIYTPELYSSRINKFLINLKSKKSIQTIPTRLKNISNGLFFSDKIVTISDFTKNLLLKRKIKNVVKINTGIDANYFKPFRKDLKLSKKFVGKFIVLIPIDLEKEKGSRIMLKVIESMKDVNNILFIFSYRSTKKRILERKYLENNLAKLGLSEKVLFVKDPKDVRSLINISSIVVYPAIDTYEKHEIPMILLESMSMEKPVIVWDIEPINEIINGNEGVKVGNYKDMKKAILKFVNDKNLVNKSGKLARKRAVTNFNIIKTAENYEKLYDNIYKK